MEKKEIAPVQELAGYVTVGKAAVMLKVSDRFIRRLIAEGELVAVRIGDHQPIWLVDKDSIMGRIDNPHAPKRRGPAKGHGGRPKKSVPTTE